MVHICTEKSQQLRKKKRKSEQREKFRGCIKIQKRKVERENWKKKHIEK